MCVQTVGLIQAEIERNGIATVAISLLRNVAEILRPPRSLFVPFKLGYPLGSPNNAQLQLSVINEALTLFEKEGSPILADFQN